MLIFVDHFSYWLEFIHLNDTSRSFCSTKLVCLTSGSVVIDLLNFFIVMVQLMYMVIL